MNDLDETKMLSRNKTTIIGDISQYNRTGHNLLLAPQCIEVINSEITNGLNGITMLIMYICVAIFIGLSNGLFIGGLYRIKTKKFSSVQRVFLTIAISDLFAGLVYVPFQVYFVFMIPNVSCSLTLMRAFTSTFPGTLSGMMIMFLTVDRYLTLSRSGKSIIPIKVKNRLFAIYVSVGMIASVCWSIWHVFITNMSANQMVSANRNFAIFFISTATLIITILTTSLFINFRIVATIKQANRQSSVPEEQKKKAEKRLSNTVLIISTALILTYLPSMFCFYIYGFYLLGLTPEQLYLPETRDKRDRYTKILVWTLILTLVNSGLNSTIFISRNTRMRKMYQSVYNRNIKWTDQIDPDAEMSPKTGTPLTGTPVLRSHGPYGTNELTIKQISQTKKL